MVKKQECRTTFTANIGLLSINGQNHAYWDEGHGFFTILSVQNLTSYKITVEINRMIVIIVAVKDMKQLVNSLLISDYCHNGGDYFDAWWSLLSYSRQLSLTVTLALNPNTPCFAYHPSLSYRQSTTISFSSIFDILMETSKVGQQARAGSYDNWNANIS